MHFSLNSLFFCFFFLNLQIEVEEKKKKEIQRKKIEK